MLTVNVGRPPHFEQRGEIGLGGACFSMPIKIPGAPSGVRGLGSGGGFASSILDLRSAAFLTKAAMTSRSEVAWANFRSVAA